MLIDETKYLWSMGQPEDIILSESPYSYIPEQALKIYRFEGEGRIILYPDAEMAETLYEGELPYEPDVPIACDGLVLVTESSEDKGEDVGTDAEAGNTDKDVTVHLIAETGILKTVLTPYLDTTENMDYLHNGYNDDGTYETAGLDGFMFNGVSVQKLYLSSNHWVGFGVNSEQLRILRRDGCSTAMYRQEGQTTNGLQFLKIRFEGYTVYSSRVEANRLIYELFLLSNNDMFLNVIQSPTNSGYLGYSELVCNGQSTSLTLADGSGEGVKVSFYHNGGDGKSWDIRYSMYEENDTFSHGFLIKQGGYYYTVSDGKLEECDISTLTAAMFLKYGVQEIPSAEVLTPLPNPEVYLWKAGGEEELLKANVKAYPYPQTLEAVADMSHISIIGIKLLTAEYSGTVGVRVSLDDGGNYAEEVLLGDWLNTDVEELWGSLPESRRVYFRFILHDNAILSNFKITYVN